MRHIDDIIDPDIDDVKERDAEIQRLRKDAERWRKHGKPALEEIKEMPTDESGNAWEMRRVAIEALIDAARESE